MHCDLRVAVTIATRVTVARVGLVVPYNFIRKLVEDYRCANTRDYTAEPSMRSAHCRWAWCMKWCRSRSSTRPLSDGLGGREQCALSLHDEEELRRSVGQSTMPGDDILEMGRAVRSSKDAKEDSRLLSKRKPFARNELTISGRLW